MISVWLSTSPIPWSNGKDACVTCRKVLVQFQPGSLFEMTVCKCLWRHASMVRTKTGFNSRTDLSQKEKLAAGPTGRRLACNQQVQLASMSVGVRFDSTAGPLTKTKWAHGPKGRCRLGVAEIRVQFSVSPLSS